ncbi:MAG TPA: hypothetical protein VJ948_08620 [Acidimicrobiia bacterium]|nr:hypothetical protein [Acidimicrobiia bacterium]
MIYLSTYRDLKAIVEERTKRSLKRLAASGAAPLDGYRRPAPQPQADVVELVFASVCDTELIGA